MIVAPTSSPPRCSERSRRYGTPEVALVDTEEPVTNVDPDDSAPLFKEPLQNAINQAEEQTSRSRLGDPNTPPLQSWA
jgi:hypothetical protein